MLSFVPALAACGRSGTDEASADTRRTTTTKRSTTTAEATTTTPPPPPPTFPLTGVVTDAASAARPALAVKIDNVARAHPQVGINQADVVYEELVEGSITRLMAIFQSTDSAPIGPVRSARPTDVALFTPLNRPMFAWSGANDWVRQMIASANIVDVGHTPAGDQYYRERSRRGPHNLFINGYNAMISTHQADAGASPALFQYRAPDEPLGAGAAPLGSVHVVYGRQSGSAPVDYTWDPARGGWARLQSGRPHVDTAGVQVAPENVIIQSVNYTILGGGVPDGQLIGQGEAWVLTNGHLIPATWSKPSPEAATQFLDAAGAPVKLTPGRTWVSLAPPGGGTITG